MKPRVLIVDDEPELLELVDFKLSGQGFEVIRASNGVEALNKARCEVPDVIVLELMLPDIDGLSVCNILGAQPSTRDVPVVVYMVLDPSFMGANSAKKKVAHWVKKGSDAQVLCDCVRSAVDEHLVRVKRRATPEQRPTREPRG